MISDVLKDAIEDIEDYQRELPVLYDPVKVDLEVIKALMWELIVKLNVESLPGR